MSRLYASGIGGTTGRQYDLQTISFGAYYLDDVYALAGEKMTEIMTDIFIDCLTSPVTENGVFTAKFVELEKKTAIELPTVHIRLIAVCLKQCRAKLSAQAAATLME